FGGLLLGEQRRRRPTGKQPTRDQQKRPRVGQGAEQRCEFQVMQKSSGPLERGSGDSILERFQSIRGSPLRRWPRLRDMFFHRQRTLVVQALPRRKTGL